MLPPALSCAVCLLPLADYCSPWAERVFSYVSVTSTCIAMLTKSRNVWVVPVSTTQHKLPIMACMQHNTAFICTSYAGLPLLPLMDGQQGTIQAYKSHQHSYFVPSKLDTELLEKAKGLLCDLELLDRECCDRCCSA